MEKSLKDAKDDLSTLNERLKVTQAELGIRDEKIQALLKQLEMKTAELTLVQKVIHVDFYSYTKFISFLRGKQNKKSNQNIRTYKN